MRLTITIAAFALSACNATNEKAAEQADLNGSAASSPSANGAIVTPIIRTRRTISDQPLKLPQGEAEMVSIAVDIPAGGALPIHKHPWSRFFYVERGTLRVVNHETGQSRDFKAGQVQAEAVGQWHEGQAIGRDPVRVIVIDLVPPGASTTITKPKTAAP
ncbi:MAG: cupin domain-containing protein [Sphingomonas sp.]|nr:cupin domain-containing protein [Sphingomonas sp.]